MPTITPFLWFDGRAEEAMELYVSAFKDEAKVLSVQKMNGKVLVVSFELLGQKFLAMNAEPMSKFNEAVSFMVNCETQEEVDWYWEKLIAGGGQESACGWLKDKFGLSWKITPTALMRLMADPDAKKSGAVFQAMLKMKKIVIADLEKAAEGRAA